MNNEMPRNPNFLETAIEDTKRKIKETIDNAPLRREQEAARTGNSWLACFSTDLQSIGTQLDILELRHPGASNLCSSVRDKFNALVKEFEESRGNFPVEISEEVKKRLSDMLSKLLED